MNPPATYTVPPETPISTTAGLVRRRVEPGGLARARFASPGGGTPLTGEPDDPPRHVHRRPGDRDLGRGRVRPGIESGVHGAIRLYVRHVGSGLAADEGE